LKYLDFYWKILYFNQEKLFDHFRQVIDNLKFIVNGGKIIDASFAEVPRQRNTKEENEQIKAGNG
jgi:hypothetical protein